MIYCIESEKYVYIGHTKQTLRKRINGHKERCKNFLNERKLGKGKKIKITKSIIVMFSPQWKAFVIDPKGGLDSERYYIKNYETNKIIVNNHDFLKLLQQLLKPDFLN